MTFWKKKTEEKPETVSAPKPSYGLDAKSKEPAVLENLDPKEKTTENTIVSQTTKKSKNDKMSTESLSERFGTIRSALGAGTVIQGKLSFDTPVRIDGKLSGEIFSSKALIVGETGEINATIDVACLVVLGKVEGVIKVSDRTELLAGGALTGELTTPVFMMEDGANFNGKCIMKSKSKGAIASMEIKKEENKKHQKENAGAASPA